MRIVFIKIDSASRRVSQTYAVALAGQEVTQGFRQLAIIVDHQDLRISVTGPHWLTTAAEVATACHTGSCTTALVPVPSVLSNRMSPPCSLTMFFAMAKPSPVPFPIGLVVKKGSNMCARCAGEMPHPLSVMT